MLVLDAHAPARKPDQKTLQQIQDFYRNNPQLKQPKTLVVLTHVDLLSPVMIWAPPYQWRTADDKKSNSIRDAVQYVQEVFGDQVQAVAPVCLSDSEDRRWGLEEEVLPAISQILPEAKSAAMLRAYEKELDKDRWWELLDQIKESGKILAQSWLESKRQRPR